MDNIQIFKDERFKNISEDEQFKILGELCYVLAGAVCAKAKEDAWTLMHNAASVGGAMSSDAFDELCCVVADELVRKHRQKKNFLDTIRKMWEGLKND